MHFGEAPSGEIGAPARDTTARTLGSWPPAPTGCGRTGAGTEVADTEPGEVRLARCTQWVTVRSRHASSSMSNASARSTASPA